MDVPSLRQENKSDCGLACLSMLLQYYNIDKSVSELNKEFDVDGVGTYVPQLGIYLLNKGFDISIVTMHPKIFTLRDRDASPELVKERIESLEEGKTKNYFLEYLKLGGEIIPEIPSAQHVEQEIAAERPVIALMTSHFLNGKEPRLNFHYNIITDIDKKTIFVNDPSRNERGGPHEHAINDFFFGIYASIAEDIDNGSLLLARKQ